MLALLSGASLELGQEVESASESGEVKGKHRTRERSNVPFPPLSSGP